MTMNPAERRPIASRELGWAKATARFLARSGVTPNAISIAGMAAGVLAGAALAATARPGFETAGFIAAVVLIQLRLLANMFDGMIAVEQKSASPVGELYNEVPDRISDAATLIGAGFAWGSSPTLGYLAACLAIFIAYVRAQGRVAGAPQEFCGPMAKPQRMAAVTLAALFAAVAPAGWQPALEYPAGWGTMALVLAVIVVGEVVTVIRRLVRIAAALRIDT
jgi:phosphatidylglycerophosphate synthase